MQLQGKYVALGLLGKRPMTGYEIKKEFESTISFFYDGSYGSVYPALAKLEQEGLIVKRTIVQEERPNKNEYAITEAGSAAFQAYLRSPLVADSIRSDLCMRLYFGGGADAGTMRSWLESGASDHRSNLETLQDFRERFELKMPLHMRLSLLMGIRYHEAHLETIQACMALLEQETMGDERPKEEYEWRS
ncbi:PadR family transcriptional regulator [Cohnella nanjingensis]|uniref:PadR family transcriptional regulator n=1 Tax=Cohnella nanjingensis TaxID=1387779 RepID=A0A7X0VDZ3_9BACL|nr:PadR family transcriptional regulator [Cohnella nanjingensis]MBB6669728.1 PadR family transcriptional regulator [Cohnella nanjingensis]